MVLAGQILCLTILLALVLLSWVLPRWLGCLGMIAVHTLIFIAWYMMGAIGIACGTWEYDDFLSALGLLMQAFQFNCIMLPVSLTAACLRWWRLAAERKASTMPARTAGTPPDVLQVAAAAEDETRTRR